MQIITRLRKYLNILPSCALNQNVTLRFPEWAQPPFSIYIFIPYSQPYLLSSAVCTCCHCLSLVLKC